MRIMIVDDDHIMNFVMNRMIQNVNDKFEVLVYSNPVEALNNTASSNPDLIFLDLSMPTMDGFMFLQKMKEQDLHIPVIIISSTLDSEDRMKTRNFDNVKSLELKPLSPKGLEKILLS